MEFNTFKKKVDDLGKSGTKDIEGKLVSYKTEAENMKTKFVGL